eukprot:CAMPEP_0180126190 /NCGR_PEP_ID=MMETSP0986-20121125/5578_1 /TAXON_ID=697907 /ORGANISM="non described non described, Strain CCMP2293" /LENGTH=73 /DNA_ID=CAMNT_0022065631 /DNA_START=75 /DNA_END=293 /DNA_ORIENTATION=-
MGARARSCEERGGISFSNVDCASHAKCAQSHGGATSTTPGSVDAHPFPGADPSPAAATVFFFAGRGPVGGVLE